MLFSFFVIFQYDVNGDGVLEFLLSTSDAEIVFVQTDNTLLHGETVKVQHGATSGQEVKFNQSQGCP